MQALGLAIVPFDVDDAEQAARLWTPGSGLSLADRACLALGLRHGVPVLTADRAWAQVTRNVDVRVIRG
jgi:PIN domain nuclease of toxin-antitoxin system